MTMQDKSKKQIVKDIILVFIILSIAFFADVIWDAIF